MAVYYRKGYKYQLAKTFICEVEIYPLEDILSSEFISLYKSGILLIASGYAWNGASGPTIDTKDTIRGSLVHDALYQLMREGDLPIGYRQDVDRELERHCEDAGMWKIRARIWYRAVQRFSRRSALPENKREVFIAP